jgi:hypothetical protein
MNSITQTPPIASATIDRRRFGAVAGMAAGPLFLAVVALVTWAELDYLHGLNWRYTKDNPVPWPSATALGPHGWVQVVNFALAGLLLLIFVRAFRAELRGIAGRVASALLFVMAAGITISAFPTDHASTLGHSPDTWHGVIHSIGFVCVALPSVVAPIFVALALRRRSGWRAAAAVSAAVPVLELLFFFPGANAWHDAAFTGYLATVFGWFALLANRLYATRGKE